MKKTIQELQQLPERKDVISIFQLGYSYDHDKSMPQNRCKAFEYYYQAATMDLSEEVDSLAFKYKSAASYNLGIMYLNGDGVLQNSQTGIKWIEDAAENGNADALYYLGQMYAEGQNNFDKDYDKANKYYLLAAKQGHADAQFDLGKMYFTGLGVPRDSEKAMEWFQKAKDNGNVYATYYLQKDWLKIWPNEDWLIKRDDDKIGQVFGATISGMAKLQEAIDLYKSTFSVLKEFSLKRDLGIGSGHYLRVDSEIAFWLQMVSKRGLAEGHYAVGRHALSIVNKIKLEMNPILLSSALQKLYLNPLDSDTQEIESYVAQYVRAKAALKRALEKGIVEAKEDLLSLEEHKEFIEILCSSIFNKYKLFAQKDDLIFKDVEALLEADKLYNENNKCFIMTGESYISESFLSKFIKQRGIEEYKEKMPCLPDAPVLCVTSELNAISSSGLAKVSEVSLESEVTTESEVTSELDAPSPYIHFLFRQEDNLDKTTALKRSLQNFSRPKTPDFNSLMQKFDSSIGGVTIWPKVNVINSSDPNFNKIMSNAFSGPNRITVTGASIARITAQAQASSSSGYSGGGQSSSSGGGASGSGGGRRGGGGDDDGNRYGGGKNAKHANQQAISSAERRLEEAKQEVKRLHSIPNKTKEQNEQFEDAKTQVKHWTKKAAFRGEHHSQNPKGNR